MNLRILGSMELVAQDGNATSPGSPRQQIVLASLALRPNRVVLTSRLIDAIWPESPPLTARSQVQGCVSALRKLLSLNGVRARIHTQGSDYQLSAADDAIDSLCFENAAKQARQHEDLAKAAEGLRAALALWRGPALHGIPSDEVRRAAAPLDEARLSAVDDLIRIELALGRHLEVIGDLRSIVAEHPLHEQSCADLMLALYRAGRPAEALEVMRVTRDTVVAELGIEPSASLQRLEYQILNSDPTLNPPDAFVTPPPRQPATSASTPSAAPLAPDEMAIAAQPDLEATHDEPDSWTHPRQLPRADADFIGRAATVKEMTRLLVATDESSREERFNIPIVGICGSGGVGKSTLAVRVAHLVADSFPDGNLYVDLHDATRDEDGGAHLTRLLRTLGLTASTIPEDVAERVELYRSTLADRRILLVLDGASSEDRVVPLLPGSPQCAIIITSRSRLDLLPGIRWFGLDVLDAETSAELLTPIVGRKRLTAEPEATERLIRYSGGLPLALRIAGARLASRPSWRIGELTRRMENEGGRLDEFSHRGLELRSSIGSSYRTLSAPSKRLFRLLALSPGPSFAAWVAAALLDVELADAQRSLDQLIDVHLLETFESDSTEPRYRFRDLIRVYAQERLLATDTEQERNDASARLFGGWLDRADRAHRAEYGGDYTILHGAAPRYHVDDLDDRIERCPLEWLDDERTSLVAVVRRSSELGMDDAAWDLALSLVSLFEVRALYNDWRETATTALSSAERAGNHLGRAATLYSLGNLHVAFKQLDAARQHFDQALEIFTENGNEHGQALTLRNDALIDRIRGDLPTMLSKSQLALEKMRAAGDPIGESNILRNLAGHAIETDDKEQASTLLKQARDLAAGAGHDRGTAQVEVRIAEMLLAAGETAEARQTLNSTLAVVQELGDRVGESHVLYLLGISRLREGRTETAEATLLSARDTASRSGAQLVEGQVLHTLAELSIGRGDYKTAATYLDGAREIFRSVGSATWMARTLMLCHDANIDNNHDELRADFNTTAATLDEYDSEEAGRLRDQLMVAQQSYGRSLDSKV